MKRRSRGIFLIGNRFLIVYLAFISAFAPISTDMYLPALPSMAVSLATSNEMASYTISSFILVFACSMLFWGPLSDRLGRKPILMAGSAIYIIASAMIALAGSIAWLLFWRCSQALGSGAISAMSLAIVKDILRGSLLEKVISWIQAATILAPITAPLIGGALLLFLGWREIFWCLAIFGGLSLAGATLLKETRKTASQTGLASTFGRIIVVLKKRQFLWPLLLFSLMAMPFMSYLAVSSFIFQDGFGISAQAYSFFFALNAAASLLGPFMHIYVFRRYRRSTTIAWQLLGMSVAGGSIMLFGSFGPWWFCLIFAIVSFCGSAMRPPATVLMLESIKGDNGIVAALINCGGLFFGSLSMFIATLGFWPDPVIAVGAIAFAISTLCFFWWLIIRKRHDPPAKDAS